ncbi:hypothetical protein K4F52_003352 [Lecanicillium sp. MT-2017a]|nr:hypothetical protein K4F52_003352 [Lecanicillium sp. MT-2017a]
MSSIVSSLFSDLGVSKAASTAVHTLEIRKSQADPAQLVFIHAAGAPENSDPLWSILNKKAGNPDILIYKGSSHPHNVFGDGSFSSFSGSAKLKMRGVPIKVKASSLGEGYNVESQQLGKMKWKPNPMTGMGLQLHDSSGTMIAKIKSSGLGMGPKSLVVYVQADEFLMDLIVFTAMAVKTIKKTEEEVASEVVQAVAGA